MTDIQSSFGIHFKSLNGVPVMHWMSKLGESSMTWGGRIVIKVLAEINNFFYNCVWVIKGHTKNYSPIGQIDFCHGRFKNVLNC